LKKSFFLVGLCLFMITGCAQQPVSEISEISFVSSSSQAETISSESTVSEESSIAQESTVSKESSIIPESNTAVFEYGDYEYEIVGDSITIVKYNGDDEELVIPDTMDGLSVTVIGEGAFKENETLKSVVISDNVILIDKAAFRKCTELESVQFGENVEEIGEGSFSACQNLKQIIINNSLKTIKKSAFDGCLSLQALDLPESVESIGEMAFEVSGIKNFVFPNKIKEINRGTFYLSDLETVVLPENVEIIGAAFAATAITEIFIPDSVISISDYAFDECSRELVLLYDNNLLVPQYAEKNNILCFQIDEYDPILTVVLVNGKPLNDDENIGISQEDYNIVKRQNNFTIEWFEYAVSNDYICFLANEERTDETIKAKLTKAATLLYQCGITDFDPENIESADSDYLDKMATLAIYSRSEDGTEVDDKKGSSGVIFVDDRTFYYYYTIFFGVDPDFSKITGHSQQQKGIWYYPKEFSEVQTEVLAFSSDAEKMEYTLTLRFTPEIGTPIKKTFSFIMTEEDTIGGEQYRITLTGIY